MNCRQLVILPALLGIAAAQPARYDVVVIGGTGGGVACAVRAAREGLNVALVNYSNHLGGMLSGGIGVMDTLYEGRRAPLLEEFNRRILDHYRTRYGENSPQYKMALPGHRTEHPTPKRLTFEPRVAEQAIDEMVGGEKRITVFRRRYPKSVERTEREILAVTLGSFDGQPDIRLQAKVFADATYEGDLAAAAGVEYRVGREAREEYGEPHAGRIFSKRLIAPQSKGMYPSEARLGDLPLRPFQAVTQEIFAGSTGEGDGKVQAYHYRLCLTNDPANRRMVEKPAWYEPEFIRSVLEEYRGLGGKPNAPNGKMAWFQNFSGEASAYARADWSERERILRRHRDFALGVVYYLQNDPAIPAERREQARQWGLPKDEFVDNGNFPYELYVREARRIVGRYVFTELDATTARGYNRTPVHEDSIAIGEWFLDSHEVSRETQPGSDADGKIILSELTRPSQIPYRTLLPKDIDNLLVPVCLSATHVGWGTIRLEPTWMHIGESAAWAAVLAARDGVAPGKLDAEKLQRRLAAGGLMLTFFNDTDMDPAKPWTAAAQYLGARGFFAGYHARGDAPLDAVTAGIWARGFGELLARKGSAAERARGLAASGAAKDIENAEVFAGRLETAAAYWNVRLTESPRQAIARLRIGPGPLRRGDACRLIFELLEKKA